MSQVLEEAEVAKALEGISGWQFKDASIRKDFQFADFSAAFACMTQLAILSETEAHHPDWSNVYNRLSITLSTHDAGGVTEKDIKWAKQCETITARYL